ncbi:MAG: NAD(P)-dependent oxidoreductase [Dehalobacterium sp.]
MLLDKENTTIGFIGTGVMGNSMAGHILKAGFKVLVHNRTREKTDELVKKGAIWKGTPAEVARDSNVIITIVGFPQDVEEVYLGEQGLINNGRTGTYLIDMTTSSPLLAKKIFEEAKKRKMYFLDAPVSGGDIGAREARLAIMVGGDETAFEEVKPLFEIMGKNIALMGRTGSGQYTKMCNQITIASTMVGLCECIAYAKKAGLEPEQMIKTIETGAAGSWSLSNYGPRMIAGDFAPGFFVKHFIKDMKIALDSAKEMGLWTPGLELAKSMYEELALKGEENSGTHALLKLYL